MPLKIVFGGGAIPGWGPWAEFDYQAKCLDLLTKLDVKVIDTARLYTGSEAALGKHESRKNFTFDTKIVGGFDPGHASKEQIVPDVEESVQRIGLPQYDILYIHAPDPTNPIEDTLEGINEAYKRGWFKRFGLSNFSAQQVQEVYDICKEKGYVLPTAYQGNYNAVARHIEKILFPTLRKLGICFYAYSPLAGGFLTKTVENLDAGVGRFNDAVLTGLYKKLYDKPSLRTALGEWNSIAEAEGVSKAELGYRWIGFHSALKEEFGDAVIFGASKIEQVEPTVGWLRKGPLSQSAVERIDKLWESVKDDAPVDNYGNKPDAKI